MNKFGNVINAVVFDNFDINALLNRKSNKKTKKNDLINRRNVGEKEEVKEKEKEKEEVKVKLKTQQFKLPKRVTFAEDVETFDFGRRSRKKKKSKKKSKKRTIKKKI